MSGAAKGAFVPVGNTIPLSGRVQQIVPSLLLRASI